MQKLKIILDKHLLSKNLTKINFNAEIFIENSWKLFEP